MIWSVLRALGAHWRRAPMQLFTILAGLALATALWSGVQAINAEARASYDAAAATLGEGQFDQLVARDGAGIAMESFVTLRRAGWLVSPVIEGRWQGARLVGLEPLTAPAGFGPLRLQPGEGVQTVIGARTLFAAPQTVLTVPSDISLQRDPTIAPGLVLGDIGLVQDLLGRSDLSRLVVAPTQPLSQPPLETIAPDLRYQGARHSSDLAELTGSFHLNLTAFGLLSFAVGLFIVHSATGLAFEQRRAMLRTLRALGVPLRTLVAVIGGEMLALALLGGVIGIGLGYLVASVLLPDVAATLQGLYGAQISGSLQFRADWWLSGVLIALLGTGLATAGRLWSVARLPLLASARPGAWASAAQSKARLQAVGAALLLLLASGLAFWGDGLIAGFALLAALLLGAALLLPVLASFGLMWLSQRATRPLAEWFWADTRQQLPGLSLALMALLLALSANIGVSTMVSSFRLTFLGFLDQRLAPELYLSVETPELASRIDASLTVRGVEVLPIVSTDATLAGLPVRVQAIRVSQTHRDNWVFLSAEETAFDAVATGRAVLVNEQFARRTGLWVGDKIADLAQGALPIAGVVGDYGNPKGQVILAETAFQSRYPGHQATEFALRTRDPSGLRAQLMARFDLPASAFTNQAEIKRFSVQVFERTFQVTAALNVLTLSVAGFAMLMSLLTLADQRVPQLAPVWALGLTRRHLGRLEILRALVLAGCVTLCAVPLGLLLAWVLLSVVNVHAFGWRLPMFVFPLDYAKLVGWALVAATLAALWPAWRLMRRRPSALLKVFANER